MKNFLKPKPDSPFSVFNLLNDINLEETRAKVEKMKQENKGVTARNRLKQVYSKNSHFLPHFLPFETFNIALHPGNGGKANQGINRERKPRKNEENCRR